MAPVGPGKSMITKCGRSNDAEGPYSAFGQKSFVVRKSTGTISRVDEYYI